MTICARDGILPHSCLRIGVAGRHVRLVETFHARRLPHYYAVNRAMFLTWRLCGSLPAQRSFPEMPSSGRAFLALDRVLDRGRTGPLYLARPEVASMAVEAIQFRERELAHYRQHAWVVMANHVHLLITPLVGISLIMQSLKRFTARGANRLLCLTGRAFWQDESFDRVVRDEAEFGRIARYIEMNPVRAGLAQTPGDFRWSSASAD